MSDSPAANRSETPAYDETVRRTGIDPRNLFVVTDGAGNPTKRHCNWSGHLVYPG